MSSFIKIATINNCSKQFYQDTKSQTSTTDFSSNLKFKSPNKKNIPFLQISSPVVNLYFVT